VFIRTCTRFQSCQQYGILIRGFGRESVALRFSWGHGDTMLQTIRPTPTCTRFQTSIEMPCMKCGAQMRLALIEPRDQNYDVLTYRCAPCDSGESFLKAR
jgi:hypothetical protein